MSIELCLDNIAWWCLHHVLEWYHIGPWSSSSPKQCFPEINQNMLVNSHPALNFDSNVLCNIIIFGVNFLFNDSFYLDYEHNLIHLMEYKFPAVIFNTSFFLLATCGNILTKHCWLKHIFTEICLNIITDKSKPVCWWAQSHWAILSLNQLHPWQQQHCQCFFLSWSALQINLLQRKTFILNHSVSIGMDWLVPRYDVQYYSIAQREHLIMTFCSMQTKNSQNVTTRWVKSPQSQNYYEIET